MHAISACSTGLARTPGPHNDSTDRPGVMQCLEAQGVGCPVGGSNVVPIVQAAVSFDRATGPVRAIRIAHGTGDGATVCTRATGTWNATATIHQISGAAADGLSRAIIRASRAAAPIRISGRPVPSHGEQFPAHGAR